MKKSGSHQHLIRAMMLDGFIPLMDRYGTTAEPLLHDVGLSLNDLAHPEHFISHLSCAKLLEKASLEVEEPYLGLELAESSLSFKLQHLAAALALRSDLKQALQYFQQHLFIYASGITLVTEIEGDVLNIKFSLGFDHKNLCTNQIYQCAVMRAKRLLEYLLSNPHQIQMLLTQPLPSSQYSHSIHFDAPFNGFQLPVQSLKAPFELDRDMIEDIILNKIISNQLEQPLSLNSQIQQTIMTLLPNGECSLNQIAQSMYISSRKLQQHLQNEQLTYSGILKKTRLDNACRLLLNTDDTITQIALQLGFTDTSSFSRFFKNTKEQTPLKWRKDQSSS